MSELHEERRAEVMAPAREIERRQWSETPAGWFRQRMNIHVPDPTPEAVEDTVNETRMRVRRERGRELYPEEVETTRRQAELRRGEATGPVRSFPTSWELAEQLRWGLTVAPKPAIEDMISPIVGAR